MNILVPENSLPRALSVIVTNDALEVHWSDGWRIAVPLSWYPRLCHATEAERANWRLIGGGEGIHWPAVEEDLSIESLIAGRPSMESQPSLARWLKSREHRPVK